MSTDWQFFSNMIHKRLSDRHFPICLKTTTLERGKTPFKFENMWLEFEGFSNLIKDTDFAIYIVANKL